MTRMGASCRSYDLTQLPSETRAAVALRAEVGKSFVEGLGGEAEEAVLRIVAVSPR